MSKQKLSSEFDQDFYWKTFNKFFMDSLHCMIWLDFFILTVFFLRSLKIPCKYWNALLVYCISIGVLVALRGIFPGRTVLINIGIGILLLLVLVILLSSFLKPEQTCKETDATLKETQEEVQNEAFTNTKKIAVLDQIIAGIGYQGKKIENSTWLWISVCSTVNVFVIYITKTMYITVVALTCILACCLYYYFHSVKDDPNSSTTKSFPLKKYSNVDSDQVDNEEGRLRRQIQLGTKVTFQEELNGFKSNSCKYYFQWIILLLLFFVVINLVVALSFLFDYIDEAPLGLHSFYQQCGLDNEYRADHADELRGSTLAWMKKMMLAQMNSYLFLPLFYLMFNILKSFVNWTEIFDKSFPMIGYLFKTDNFFDVRVNVTLNMINEVNKNGTTKYKVDMRTLAEMSVTDFFGGKQAAKDLFPRILRKHKEREGYAGETGSTCLKKKWPVKRDKYFPFVQTKDPHSSEKHSAISEQINDQIRNRLSSIFGPTYITEDQQGSCAVSSKEYVFGVTFEKMDNGVSFTSSTLNTLCTSQNFRISLTAHFFSLFFFLFFFFPLSYFFSAK